MQFAAEITKRLKMVLAKVVSLSLDVAFPLLTLTVALTVLNIGMWIPAGQTWRNNLLGTFAFCVALADLSCRFASLEKDTASERLQLRKIAILASFAAVLVATAIAVSFSVADTTFSQFDILLHQLVDVLSRFLWVFAMLPLLRASVDFYRFLGRYI